MKIASASLSLILVFLILFSPKVFAQPVPPVAPTPPSAPAAPTDRPVPPQAPEPPEMAIKRPHAPEEVLIKFKEEPSGEFLRTHKLKSAEKVVEKDGGLEKLYLAQTERNTDLVEVLKDLSDESKVEYAQLNFQVKAIATIPNDPDFLKLWGLENTGQTGGVNDADIDASSAWDSQKTTDIVVGIIDTGVDYNHEDLAGNMWRNPGEIASDGVDNDNNGYIDDIFGWDFVSGDNDPTDDYGHGTHVAGTIAGEGNNGKGIVGVNWSGKVASLKFLDSEGSGWTDDAVRALAYANKMGFKITNNSWGGGGYSQALYDAIAAANSAGNLFIAAAGNSGANMDTNIEYPAGYNLPNIISVAATDHNDKKAGFSNWGLTTVDLGAPGVSIYSTVPKGNCVLCDSSGYLYLSGTSMASPHVAGAAALVWAKYPSLNHMDIKNKLMSTSDQISALMGKTVSGGRLNLSTPTPTPASVTVFSDSFEVSEWNDLWTEDSQNDWYRSRQRRVGTGRWAAEVDGLAADAQLISKVIDLQGKNNATITFSWLIEDRLDAGEYLAFDVSVDNGATWQEKGKLRGNVDPENSWQNFSLNLANINNLRVRFRGLMSDSSEDANVDQVNITAN